MRQTFLRFTSCVCPACILTNCAAKWLQPAWVHYIFLWRLFSHQCQWLLWIVSHAWKDPQVFDGHSSIYRSFGESLLYISLPFASSITYQTIANNILSSLSLSFSSLLSHLISIFNHFHKQFFPLQNNFFQENSPTKKERKLLFRPNALSSQFIFISIWRKIRRTVSINTTWKKTST